MKKGLIIFITICILICALPLVGMAVRPTIESTENRELSSFPSIKGEDGSLNLNFFQEFEKYFSEHFAFRNELVYVDARVQSKVFGVSSTDSVTVGKDGWLYYSSTIDDYLGTDRLTDREIHAIARNITIVKQYLDGKGIDFVVTIPPNKNTLYGENMPYQASYIVDGTHDMEKVAQILESEGVLYADILNIFREQPETLYLKRDSHWNNKGALIAYNAILDAAGYKHDDFASAEVTRAIDYVGDLSKMLYTFYGEKEANYRYSLPYSYEYLSDFTSVEDAWIVTKNDEGKKNLLMFRDSFGNTLIAFMANQFKNASFSKGQPYNLETLIEETMPDLVIIERVERSIEDFITMPPLITAPEYLWPYSSTNGLDEAIETGNGADEIKSDTTIEFGSMPYDSRYYMVSGEIDSALINDTSEVLVKINSRIYEAYSTKGNGYDAYFKKIDFPELPVTINIIVRDKDSGKLTRVKSTTID